MERVIAIMERRHTLRGCVDWNKDRIQLLRTNLSHTLRGCVDWNCISRIRCGRSHGHTLRGCVDWNIIIYVYLSLDDGHTLRGCVDWNRTRSPSRRLSDVTPCVGVWIETSLGLIVIVDSMSHPAWVCGLKLFLLGLQWYWRGHTLRGCVDWNLAEKMLLK